jgi:hypothetical protein
MPSDPNPYASPTYVSPPTPNRRIKASPRLLVAFVSAAVAYAIFTTILLTSTPVDQRHGAMFIWNLPILCLMMPAALWSKRAAAILALLASVVQISIAILSRYLAMGGDVIGTVLITGPIVLVLLGLAFWALQPPGSARAKSNQTE